MNYYKKGYAKDYEEDFYRSLPHAEKHTFHREWISMVLLVLVLAGLFYGLVRLSIFKYSFYQAQAAGNRIAKITLPAPRGEIHDRKGRPLAINHAVYDCFFISSTNIDQDVSDLTALASMLGMGAEQTDTVVSRRIEAGSARSLESELWATEWGELGAKSILVKRDLNQVEVAAILERKLEFPRAYIERSFGRSYPAGESAAHIVGYLQEISRAELDEWQRLGYRMGDMVGKSGLERHYDNILRGRPGEQLVAVDARGQILGGAQFVPAVVPNNGAVVVRGDEVAILNEGDVTEFSGGIRISLLNGTATATRSVYSPGENSERIEQEILFRDTGNGGEFRNFIVFRRPGEAAQIDGIPVMRNPVISPVSGSLLRTTIDLDMQRDINVILGNHVGSVVAMDPRNGSILALVSEPGFDPNLFSASGADRSGWNAILSDPHFPLLNRAVQNAYVPGSTFKLVTFLAGYEKGSITPGRSWLCQGRIEIGDRYFNCWKRSGHGRVDPVRAVADSCDVAFWLIGAEIGQKAITDMALRTGFGAPTGIDLPFEKGGLIPDEEWKLNRWKERWYTGDTLNMSIGQGFLQVNLIQQAVLTSLVANGGYLVPPHINQLLTPDPSMLEKLNVPDSAINFLQRGMRECITSGTARVCNLNWIELAGKTGTADDPPRKEPHSWFISYGPYSSPKLALVVFLENGAHGDIVASALSAQIWNCESVRAYLAE
ncbi:MAG TPA: hypothetical protein ENN67_05175 [Firmicutes bacterium]|nr:hypothetical protein [Bacillota bacterium]